MAHGLGLSALAWWVVLSTPPPKLPPIDRDKLLALQVTRDVAEMEKVQPPPPPPPPPPQPKKKPQPRPEEQKQKPDDHFKDDSGEHNGIGTANRSNKGDQPMQAHQGYEQADLMHPNAKNFDEQSDRPASAGKPEDSIAGRKQPSRAGQSQTESDEVKQSTDNIAAHAAAIAIADDRGTRPVPKIEAGAAASSVRSGETKPTKPESVAKAPTADSSGLKEVRGHHAEESDTDSMAFAKQPVWVFKNGKLEGRKGLKVTTTQVRLNAVSERELFSLGFPRTLFAVIVDESGKIKRVDVKEKSGSDFADQDRENAIWNWTLEPEKDKDGKVINDLWVVSIE